MAVRLPNGATVALSTAYGAAIPITALTNGFPAVATSAGHGLATGDVVVLNTGWGRFNERTVRVGAVTADTFELAGVDTTDTERYPPGSGVGSAVEITGWTPITQVLDLTSNGGDMQFTNFSLLENDFESQLPTQFAAISLQLVIADDASLPGYQALEAAGDTAATRTLRLTLPAGAGTIYFNGVVSFNPTPSLAKNNVMSVRANFALQARPMRYGT